VTLRILHARTLLTGRFTAAHTRHLRSSSSSVGRSSAQTSQM
jgi:hypothetical protein